MEFTARVERVLPLQEGTNARTGNPWAKQNYILRTLESYPRNYQISLFGADRIKEHNLKEGDKVLVDLAPGTAREYNGRWYNDDCQLISLKHILTEGEALVQTTKETIDAANAAAASTAPASPAVAPADEKKEEGDGLPF